MAKVIGGVVEQRRIVVDAPDDWPDGTEVLLTIGRSDFVTDQISTLGG